MTADKLIDFKELVQLACKHWRAGCTNGPLGVAAMTCSMVRYAAP